MAVQVNQSGTWKPLVNAQVRQSGAWTQVKGIYVNKAGTWTLAWQNEVRVTLASQNTSANLRSLFDATTWASATPKRVVVPAGVTINSNNWLGALYLDAGTAWGGTLTVDVAGSLYGIGGVYLSNSGEGGAGIGSAIAGASGQRITVNVLTGGTVYAGGGAGGRGGTGGGGSYSYQTSNQYAQPDAFLSNTDYFWLYSAGQNTIQWAGNVEQSYYGGGTVVGGYDGATYYQGSYITSGRPSSGTYAYTSGAWYGVSRVTYGTAYTSGGAGGYGGRGQGADGVAASGASGSGGGTNAGMGGTGGTGGAWGAQGASGSTGASGNNGGGAAGAAGGLGGRYAYGYLTFNNAGTVAGRLALS